jgi:trimethylguanosine synthase
MSYEQLQVIACDIDLAQLEMARHNANIYGVASRIEFVHGDTFKLARSFSVDAVFLSPPWGGPRRPGQGEVFDPSEMIPQLGRCVCMRALLGPAC